MLETVDDLIISELYGPRVFDKVSGVAIRDLMQVVPPFLGDREAVSVQIYFASRFLFCFSLPREAVILVLLDSTTR